MVAHHVLIVDDQRDARRVLRSGLETMQYKLKITDVPSAEEALLVMDHQPIDLLVSDVRLPGMSGLELQKRVRQINPGMKLILVTGVSDSAIRQAVTQASADAFFFKPVDLDDFLDAVEHCLGTLGTILPPMPTVIEPEPEPEVNLSDRLASLRQDWNARSTMLITERGQVVARAGDILDLDDEDAFFLSVMATLGNASKVSSALGIRPPEDLFYFQGMRHDLYVTHIGGTMALVMQFNAGKVDQSRMVYSAIRPVVHELLKILSSLGVMLDDAPVSHDPAVESEPEEEPVLDEELPALDDLFGQVGQLLPADGLDAFWEAAVDGAENEVLNADVLTYDQARQLGLAPDEEES